MVLSFYILLGVYFMQAQAQRPGYRGLSTGCRIPRKNDRRNSYYENFDDQTIPLRGWVPAPKTGSPWELEKVIDEKRKSKGKALGLSSNRWDYIPQTFAKATKKGPYSLTPGATVGAVVRASERGRLYLNFQSDAVGTSSFVMATNSDNVIFQDNPGYSFKRLSSEDAVIEDQAWYRMEIQIVDRTSVIGRVCSLKNNKLIAPPLFQSFDIIDPDLAVGLRGFGSENWLVDDLYVLKPGKMGPLPPRPFGEVDSALEEEVSVFSEDCDLNVKGGCPELEVVEEVGEVIVVEEELVAV